MRKKREGGTINSARYGLLTWDYERPASDDNDDVVTRIIHNVAVVPDSEFKTANYSNL